MAGVALNQIVRLTAWNVFRDVDHGTSHGTCITAMDAGTTAKLMKVADASYLQNTPEPLRTSDSRDQMFTLVETTGGFRIVQYGTNRCLDAGDWFSNPDGSRTNVRHLVLRPIDDAAQSQVFSAEKGEGYSQVDAYKLLCTLDDGQRYELTPNDNADNEWVLVTLGRGPGTPSYDLFAIQAQPTIRVAVENRLSYDATFEVRWAGGRSAGVRVHATESAVIALDGVTPPRGTSCWMAARTSMSDKIFESSDNFNIASAVNDPYIKYTLYRGDVYIQFKSEFFG